MKKLFLSAIGLVILISIPVSGTIINVPADYSTIQGGINASVSGDTVLVANGTFTENINFTGKAILLTSQNGPNSTTIAIQTSGVSVVTFSSGEGPGSILSGFTIDGDLSRYTPHNDKSPSIVKPDRSFPVLQSTVTYHYGAYISITLLLQFTTISLKVMRWASGWITAVAH